MNDRNWWILAAVGLFYFFKSKRRGITPRPQAEKITPAPAAKVAPAADGWTSWRELLAQKESGGRYDARRPGSQYWGRYQLGTLARANTSAKGVRWSQFMKNEQLQNKAIKEWTARALRELKAQPDARAAVAAGKATWAQLVAMDHLTGRAATMKWIRTGKATRDANQVSNYEWGLPFAGFNIDSIERAST